MKKGYDLIYYKILTMSTLAEDFIARSQANTRPMGLSRHQLPQVSKGMDSSTSLRDPVTLRHKKQDIKIEADSRSAHGARSVQQAVIPRRAFSPNPPHMVESPRDKTLKIDRANPASSGTLLYVATTEPSPIGSPQRRNNQVVMTAPSLRDKTTSTPERKLAPNTPVAVGRHVFVFVAAIGVLIASLWWSRLGVLGHSLVARHTSIDASVHALERASKTLNTYRSTMPACTPLVENLISQSIILLDRDIRNAADIAVQMLGAAILYVPHRDTKIDQGLSCSQTGRLALKLDEVAQQCSHVASRHKEALVYTQKANRELGGAARSIIAERNKLHASRKNKHRQALEHVKELIGLSSDAAIDTTVARYKEMADAIHISEKAWNETVSATNIQHLEYTVWKSVKEKLEDLEANLRDKADMRKRSAACLNASEIRELSRVLDVEMKKVNAVN